MKPISDRLQPQVLLESGSNLAGGCVFAVLELARRLPPFLECWKGSRAPLFPFLFAMFPVGACGLALQVPNPEEDQGIQPTLFAGLAKDILVNPFLEAETEEPGLD